MDHKVQSGKDHRNNHRGGKTKDHHDGKVCWKIPDCLVTSNSPVEGVCQEGVLDNIQILELNFDQPLGSAEELSEPLMGPDVVKKSSDPSTATKTFKKLNGLLGESFELAIILSSFSFLMILKKHCVDR